MQDKPAQPLSGTPSSLAYEETPVIDPHSGEVVNPEAQVPSPSEASSVVPEAARVFAPQTETKTPSATPMTPVPRSDQNQPGKKRHIGTIFFVVLLFGLGIWLSSQLRSFFSPAVSEEVIVPTFSPQKTPDTGAPGSASSSGLPGATGWVTYGVQSGVTKQLIAGVTYQLPGEVKAPTCDGASCASLGTNLPGGTRFTIAARGKGQLLPDFRGAILTDAAGREFVMEQAVIGNINVYEYTGDFTGRTGGGYTFTNIRGVLLPISDTLSIELNHFAPAGIVTDFVKDDAVFDNIIKSFDGAAPVTPTTIPTLSLPASAPATSAGY